ncbi:MAG: hypothetical protein JEY71_11360 [Sphaerochaeta sp.]|nr:hypothetical protein [Sphaerochaeta sp.]
MGTTHMQQHFGQEIFSNGDPEHSLPMIGASTGSSCHRGIFHAIGAKEERERRAIRFRFGRYTTYEELNRTISMPITVIH